MTLSLKIISMASEQFLRKMKAKGNKDVSL
jgi:hypothetical protein